MTSAAIRKAASPGHQPTAALTARPATSGTPVTKQLHASPAPDVGCVRRRSDGEPAAVSWRAGRSNRFTSPPYDVVMYYTPTAYSTPRPPGRKNGAARLRAAPFRGAWLSAGCGEHRRG